MKSKLKRSSKIFFAFVFVVLIGGIMSVTRVDAAYLNISGFETGNTLEAQSSFGTVSVQSTTKRTGSYALKSNPTATTGGVDMRGLSASGFSADLDASTVYSSVSFYYVGNPSVDQNVLGYINSASVNLARLILTTSGQIQAQYWNGADAATSVGSAVSLTPNTWYTLELAAINTTTPGSSTVEWRLNGVVQATLGSLTIRSANRDIDWVRLGAGAAVTSETYYDDFAISNSAYPGIGRVHVLKPRAAGNNTAWTGTNVDVDEVPHDSDTTYISHSAGGAESYLLDTAASVGIGGDIKVVKSVGIVRDEGGASSMALFIGAFGIGAERFNSYLDHGATYVTTARLDETYPSGSAAWTTTNLDNTVIGLNATAVAVRATALYAMVWSTGIVPISSTTDTPTGVNSFYATLRGAANPNGSQTYGHFRVYTTNPSNCNSDSGGFRFPELQSNDLDLGSGTSVVSAPTFQFTIPFNGSTFLLPNTTYWYCAYAIGSSGTVGASSVQTFSTIDGPASPCDPPTSGNLTIPASSTCAFPGTYSGVDSGTGTKNTGLMTLEAGANLTVSSTQRIAFGSLRAIKTSTITFQRGATLRGGGLFVHDKDRDGVIDSATQYIGSTPSASTEFVRRNTLSTNYNYAWKLASSGATLDCNPNSAYAYRILPNLVRDADNDGYKTSTAAGNQCVGASAVFNGRTYYNDGSGPN